MKRAVELEPLGLGAHAYWGRILFYLRQYPRAIDQLRKTLELDQNFATAHEWLGDAYEQRGMYGDAVAEWGKALTLRGTVLSLDQAYAASGFEASVRALARQRL